MPWAAEELCFRAVCPPVRACVCTCARGAGNLLPACRSHFVLAGHLIRQNSLSLPVLKKVKVAHTRLPSVGFRSWSWFFAVSLQVTWVINPAVGCHYFPPGLQLPPQPLRGLLPFFSAWWTESQWVWTVCRVTTRQRRGCDLNPAPSVPESSTLTTRLPSHPWEGRHLFRLCFNTINSVKAFK